VKIAHLTTVDMSLRFLVFPQLTSIVEVGGEAIGISGPGKWVDELEAAGVRHIALVSSTRGVDWAADLRAMRELWRALRRERPDILHTHNPKPGVYGRILGRLAGVPVVVNTVHGFYATPDDPLPKRLVVYLLEAVASRFSDVELFQNPEDLALARRVGLVPKSRSFLLGNGVDLRRFDPARFSRSDRERTRAELGLAPDDVVVGIVGRLVAEKGYPELFQAARSWPDGVRLVVVGPDDPTKEDALPRSMIDEARHRGVTFLGMREDVDVLYSAFDLFVLPSHREGFPRAAMEAAAMGLPIVATDIRGCRQVVDDGVTGMLVGVGDPAAITDAVLELSGDAARRRRMGEAAATRAREQFDERRVVQIVHDAHRSAWESRGRAWPLGSLQPRTGYEVRPGVVSDAASIATLHAAGISTGFLSSLGRGFLTHLYEAMIESPECAVFVASDAGGSVIGYVAGTRDTGAFYRRFMRSGRAARAGVSAVGRLVRPANARRALETLRYGADDRTDAARVDAELLAMAVAPSSRGLGVGRSLVVALVDWFRRTQVPAARVVVGESNEGAIALYRSAGFGEGQSTEVHHGDASLVLTWRG
jgi:glycosyltransferase involved in cell wall biosynthesis/ribosomal protein S18 acetylase RimI-like enzyme